MDQLLPDVLMIPVGVTMDKLADIQIDVALA
jgi:hypothetical protein